MIVELNANEVLVATYIGSRRNAEASFKGRQARFPDLSVMVLWGGHIESAHAELAVCKYLGIYWGFGVNTFHVEDIVNTNFEIRWSPREDLKVRPDDKGIIISVTGKLSHLRNKRLDKGRRRKAREVETYKDLTRLLLCSA
jgi:hypothetical protein